jgi:endonuclease/exonuclease/phosphatase family metal-dependent hydrolase
MAGKSVIILHAHPYSTKPGPPSRMEWTISEREQQARAIREFARTHADPLIVPIDLNSTDQNTPYSLLTPELVDAWQEAGWGLGHTFPGASSPGSSRPTFAGIAAPMWLVRIDYVFHSRHFRAVEARTGPWDGISDHRPVVAHLAWIGN